MILSLENLSLYASQLPKAVVPVSLLLNNKQKLMRKSLIAFVLQDSSFTGELHIHRAAVFEKTTCSVVTRVL